MQADWYLRLFLDTRLARTAVEKLETIRNGFRQAVSIGGSITGLGGDILILDDPLNAGAAASEAERRNVREAYSPYPFLGSYRQFGVYYLLLAIVDGRGEADFLTDLVILKRKLVIKALPEVSENDVESILLWSDRRRKI